MTKVMVVYGHNKELRYDLFGFLRALALRPMEWQEVLGIPRDRAEYTGRAVRAAIEAAQAVVVLFTPDDVVAADDESTAQYRQARPNVFFECGLALGSKPEQTLIVEWGIRSRRATSSDDMSSTSREGKKLCLTLLLAWSSAAVRSTAAVMTGSALPWASGRIATGKRTASWLQRRLLSP